MFHIQYCYMILLVESAQIPINLVPVHYLRAPHFGSNICYGKKVKSKMPLMQCNQFWGQVTIATFVYKI